jgi:hypothetical protein
MFIRDLVGPMLTSWNALLQRLAFIQLSQGANKCRWNLHESGKFSVDSMYRDLIQPEVPFDNRKDLENGGTVKD